MPNPYAILRSLYAEGGVEIVTPGVARTFIQPDADVIHYLAEELVHSPDAEARFAPHFKKLEDFLDSLRKAQWISTWAFWGLVPLIWLWVGIDWFHLGEWKPEMVYRLIFGLIPPVLKPALMLVFRHLLRKKIDALQVSISL